MRFIFLLCSLIAIVATNAHDIVDIGPDEVPMDLMKHGPRRYHCQSYVDRYPDLQETYGTDCDDPETAEALWKHFQEFGCDEDRDASPAKPDKEEKDYYYYPAYGKHYGRYRKSRYYYPAYGKRYGRYRKSRYYYPAYGKRYGRDRKSRYFRDHRGYHDKGGKWIRHKRDRMKDRFDKDDRKGWMGHFKDKRMDKMRDRKDERDERDKRGKRDRFDRYRRKGGKNLRGDESVEDEFDEEQEEEMEMEIEETDTEAEAEQ